MDVWEELPGLDTGVCVVGGTAIGMLTRVEVPLFESVAAEARCPRAAAADRGGVGTAAL